MGLIDQDMWVESEQIECKRSGVDGPMGHVALNWSLCGPQDILSGDDLCLVINPSP